MCVASFFRVYEPPGNLCMCMHDAFKRCLVIIVGNTHDNKVMARACCQLPAAVTSSQTSTTNTVCPSFQPSPTLNVCPALLPAFSKCPSCSVEGGRVFSCPSPTLLLHRLPQSCQNEVKRTSKGRRWGSQCVGIFLEVESQGVCVMCR